jgi:hypothetical protein
MCMENVRIARKADAQKPVLRSTAVGGIATLPGNPNRYSLSASINVTAASDTQMQIFTKVGGVAWTVMDVGSPLLGTIEVASIGGDNALDVFLAETSFRDSEPGK